MSASNTNTTKTISRDATPLTKSKSKNKKCIPRQNTSSCLTSSIVASKPYNLNKRNLRNYSYAYNHTEIETSPGNSRSLKENKLNKSTVNMSGKKGINNLKISSSSNNFPFPTLNKLSTLNIPLRKAIKKNKKIYNLNNCTTIPSSKPGSGCYGYLLTSSSNIYNKSQNHIKYNSITLSNKNNFENVNSNDTSSFNNINSNNSGRNNMSNDDLTLETENKLLNIHKEINGMWSKSNKKQQCQIFHEIKKMFLNIIASQDIEVNGNVNRNSNDVDIEVLMSENVKIKKKNAELESRVERWETMFNKIIAKTSTNEQVKSHYGNKSKEIDDIKASMEELKREWYKIKNQGWNKSQDKSQNMSNTIVNIVEDKDIESSNSRNEKRKITSLLTKWETINKRQKDQRKEKQQEKQVERYGDYSQWGNEERSNSKNDSECDNISWCDNININANIIHNKNSSTSNGGKPGSKWNLHLPKYSDFNKEFLENYDEFSPSWRRDADNMRKRYTDKGIK